MHEDTFAFPLLSRSGLPSSVRARGDRATPIRRGSKPWLHAMSASHSRGHGVNWKSLLHVVPGLYTIYLLYAFGHLSRIPNPFFVLF